MWSSPLKDTRQSPSDRDTEDARTVYIGNLTSAIPSDLLLQSFTTRFGPATLLHRADNQNDDHLGFAFLKCATVGHLEHAIAAYASMPEKALVVQGRALVMTRRKKYSERRVSSQASGTRPHSAASPAAALPLVQGQTQAGVLGMGSSSSPRTPRGYVPRRTTPATTPWRDVATLSSPLAAASLTAATAIVKTSPGKQQSPPVRQTGAQSHRARVEGSAGARRAVAGDLPFAASQIVPIRTVFHSDLILVNNLPPTMNPQQLFEMFFSCDPEAAYIYPQPDVYGQRYGELQFADSQAASRAMSTFDEVAVDGYIIKLGYRPHMLEADWHQLQSQSGASSSTMSRMRSTEGSSRTASNGNGFAEPMQQQRSTQPHEQAFSTEDQEQLGLVGKNQRSATTRVERRAPMHPLNPNQHR